MYVASFNQSLMVSSGNVGIDLRKQEKKIGMGIPDVVRKIKDVGEGRLEKMKVDNSSKLFVLGVMKTINVNKMTSAGCKVKIWIADCCWKLSASIENVEFLRSSDEIKSKAPEKLGLWHGAISLQTGNNSLLIMGRNEKDDLTAAQIFYPCMQCADVFFLKADICQLGMDQMNKDNVLYARNTVCDQKGKPRASSSILNMLPGLLEGQEKMSKSNSSSAVFMEDEENDVISKIKKAYCPPSIVEGNPCLEYIKYIVFPWFNKFEVERKEENGGAKVTKLQNEASAFEYAVMRRSKMIDAFARIRIS
ncbi:tyrosine--tRNA ligase 1, cytoplasmic-like protein isoform X1 [Tanacetum coccineum]|uniref:tyrosine--tRNA ligase n=1 Tax=Tanacetum coccineum TaxID=301880 RepID=A0ABQ5A279_9ASTR